MSLAKLQDLSGRIALVTGGSRGLGLQMAEVLGELGARIAITARKAGELEEAKAHGVSATLRFRWILRSDWHAISCGQGRATVKAALGAT